MMSAGSIPAALRARWTGNSRLGLDVVTLALLVVPVLAMVGLFVNHITDQREVFRLVSVWADPSEPHESPFSESLYDSATAGIGREEVVPHWIVDPASSSQNAVPTSVQVEQSRVVRVSIGAQDYVVREIQPDRPFVAGPGLLEGVLPDAPGEALASVGVFESLGLHVGESLEVEGHSPLLITGKLPAIDSSALDPEAPSILVAAGTLAQDEWKRLHPSLEIVAYSYQMKCSNSSTLCVDQTSVLLGGVEPTWLNWPRLEAKVPSTLPPVSQWIWLLMWPFVAGPLIRETSQAKQRDVDVLEEFGLTKGQRRAFARIGAVGQRITGVVVAWTVTCAMWTISDLRWQRAELWLLMAIAVVGACVGAGFKQDVRAATQRGGSVPRVVLRSLGPKWALACGQLHRHWRVVGAAAVLVALSVATTIGTFRQTPPRQQTVFHVARMVEDRDDMLSEGDEHFEVIDAPMMEQIRQRVPGALVQQRSLGEIADHQRQPAAAVYSSPLTGRSGAVFVVTGPGLDIPGTGDHWRMVDEVSVGDQHSDRVVLGGGRVGLVKQRHDGEFRVSSWRTGQEGQALSNEFNVENVASAQPAAQMESLMLGIDAARDLGVRPSVHGYSVVSLPVNTDNEMIDQVAAAFDNAGLDYSRTRINVISAPPNVIGRADSGQWSRNLALGALLGFPILVLWIVYAWLSRSLEADRLVLVEFADPRHVFGLQVRQFFMLAAIGCLTSVAVVGAQHLWW